MLGHTREMADGKKAKEKKVAEALAKGTRTIANCSWTEALLRETKGAGSLH